MLYPQRKERDVRVWKKILGPFTAIVPDQKGTFQTFIDSEIISRWSTGETQQLDPVAQGTAKISFYAELCINPH